MAIKGRQTLYSIFYNGAIPTQNDYRDLIDSGLNRRDDRFFGEWQKGMKYCEGDVVIYKKALYKLIKKEPENPCPPDDGTTEQDEIDDGCYCSLTEPPLDKEHWCVLELELKDKDWEIVCIPDGDPDGIASKVYQMTADIGIGTNAPKAKLDITDQNKILLSPNDNGSPDISLQKNANPDTGIQTQNYVKYRLTQDVCWETDALAYVFKLVPEENSPALSKSAKALKTQEVAPLLLMKVTANEKHVPQVGIGTDDPKGGLDVHQENRGKVLINPGNHNEPGVLIVDLQEDSNGYYFLSGVNNNYTFLSTNAAGGFRFKKEDRNKEDLLNGDSAATGKDLVTILGNGKVGIGTVDPKSNAEITDADSGSFRFQLANDREGIGNPALSINNLRPDPAKINTYLAMGVDDIFGSFITDAPSGFVFKAGGKYGVNQNEVDINQGDKLAFIGPTGKVGIQTSSPPEDYDLDVNGQVKSLTAHQGTNAQNIDVEGDIKFTDKTVIEQLEKLKPIYFNWKDKTGLAGEGRQIGFKADHSRKRYISGIGKSSGIR